MVFCSQAFSILARAQARALGMERPRLIVLPHPFGSLPDEAVKDVLQRGRAEVLAVIAGKKEAAEVM
ncbi:MAG: hypothetical protein HYX87_09695 [Chloroflexi bacterium]|nr:hypothetical protein [Chloroflexota bacterium]